MMTKNILDSLPFEGLKTKKLLSNETGSIILISLEKGSELTAHTSPTDASILILEGDVKFKINDTDNVLSKNDLFSFKKNEIHAVEALSNAKLILIK